MICKREWGVATSSIQSRKMFGLKAVQSPTALNSGCSTHVQHYCHSLTPQNLSQDLCTSTKYMHTNSELVHPEQYKMQPIVIHSSIMNKVTVSLEGDSTSISFAVLKSNYRILTFKIIKSCHLQDSCYLPGPSAKH